MKFHKIFAAGAMLAAMVLAGCSDDHINGPDINAPEGDFYATLKLSLPIGSRASTIDPDDNTNSSDGYEVGQEYENTVASVFVVLATATTTTTEGVTTTTYHKFATANSNLSTNSSDGNPTYTLTFQNSDLQQAATQQGATPTIIYVFAYCNASASMQEKINTATDFSAPEGDVTVVGQTIWGKNAFLMSNRQITQIQGEEGKPGYIPSDLSKYNTPANAFPLGTVNVQRAAVRFDFKQKNADATANLAANEYAIKHEITNINMGSIQLTDMALVNQSNTYYLLARTSQSALWKNPELCVRENPDNWVVSTNKELKQTTIGSGALADKIAEINAAFTYTGRTVEEAAIDFNSSDFEWTTITDITKNPEDNHKDGDKDSWPGDHEDHYTGDVTGYHIWRYTTENTIPGNSGSATGTQRRGITTGVIFKGYISSLNETADTEGTSTTINAAFQAGRVLYGFEGVILGDKDAVKAYAEKYPNSGAAAAYNSAFNGDNVNAAGDLVESYAGFTVYRPTNIGTEQAPQWRYYVYYTYWNRHWDNGISNQMRDMEFATVRNNVYKLYVEKINQFGHPGDPGDDPDPEDPDDPDESDKVYFKVSVRVLPWVVRVNNIIL